MIEIVAQFWYIWAFFVGFFVVRRRRHKELKGEKEILVIGHKGAAGYEFENTNESFKKALEIGTDYIECDVRKSSDGVFFLSHNDKIKTIKNKNISISNSSSLLLKEITLRKGLKLATLLDYINMMPSTQKMYFDLKIKGAEFPFLAILREKKLVDRCVVTSYFAQSLRLLKALEPNLKTGISFPRDRFHTLIKLAFSPFITILLFIIRYTYPFYLGFLCRYANADFIAVQFRILLSKRLIKKAHDRGILVFSFVVNRKRHIRKMIKWGVDGIISDYPDRVKEILR